MSMTDPVGDMLSRIRNAIQAKREKVEIPSSNFKVSLAELLKREGYIHNFDVSSKGPKKVLRISLKYNAKGKNVINFIKRISTPGRHLYVPSNKIPSVMGGFGTAVISTSKGLLTDRNARKGKIGGELICYIG
jgi:small subunit ribosomal protein S8